MCYCTFLYIFTKTHSFCIMKTVHFVVSVWLKHFHVILQYSKYSLGIFLFHFERSTGKDKFPLQSYFWFFSSWHDFIYFFFVLARVVSHIKFTHSDMWLLDIWWFFKDEFLKLAQFGTIIWPRFSHIFHAGKMFKHLNYWCVYSSYTKCA